MLYMNGEHVELTYVEGSMQYAVRPWLPHPEPAVRLPDIEVPPSSSEVPSIDTFHTVAFAPNLALIQGAQEEGIKILNTADVEKKYPKEVYGDIRGRWSMLTQFHQPSNSEYSLCSFQGSAPAISEPPTPGDASEEQPSSPGRPTTNTALQPATDNAAQPTQDNTQPALELGGLSARALNAKALQLLSSNPPELNAARLDLEKAAQLEPGDIEILNNLGAVYGRIGEYRSAETILLRVLSLAPNRRVAFGNLGSVEAKLGKTEAAANYFCQYVRRFDSLQSGKATLARVFVDPDPNVQNAVKATVTNCMP
jgi:tetratricopeptide (TPR) repeat protein